MIYLAFSSSVFETILILMFPSNRKCLHKTWTFCTKQWTYILNPYRLRLLDTYMQMTKYTGKKKVDTLRRHALIGVV